MLHVKTFHNSRDKKEQKNHYIILRKFRGDWVVLTQIKHVDSLKNIWIIPYTDKALMTQTWAFNLAKISLKIAETPFSSPTGDPSVVTLLINHSLFIDWSYRRCLWLSIFANSGHFSCRGASLCFGISLSQSRWFWIIFGQFRQLLWSGSQFMIRKFPLGPENIKLALFNKFKLLTTHVTAVGSPARAKYEHFQRILNSFLSNSGRFCGSMGQFVIMKSPLEP